MRAALLTLALSGCAADMPPEFVSYPVVQIAQADTESREIVPGETVVTERVIIRRSCVKHGQIPPEPPLIGDRLTGIAPIDVAPLAQSARQLREALRRSRELLLKCAGDGK